MKGSKYTSYNSRVGEEKHLCEVLLLNKTKTLGSCRRFTENACMITDPRVLVEKGLTPYLNMT